MTKRSKPGKRGRKFQDVAEYQSLAAMQDGESRFYADVRPTELYSVRRMCLKLGMEIVMRYTQEDPKTQEAGTRMWVVKKGSKVALRQIEAHSEVDDEEL